MTSEANPELVPETEADTVNGRLTVLPSLTSVTVMVPVFVPK